MKKIKLACLIDDDPIFIYGTKRLMNEIDFCEEALVYNNGQSALDGLRQRIERGEHFPEVILLDLNMPIMNGWDFLDEFCKIERTKEEDVTVYIISSSIDPRDLEKVKNYDIIHNYILKPLSPKDLETVKEAMVNH